MWSGFRTAFLNDLNPVSAKIKADYAGLAVVILIAILLRVATAFYLGDQVVELPGTQDQISYDHLAQRVLAGYGFSFAEGWWPATPAGEPTAHWSYLYTLYLVAVYGLVGHHPLAARLIQAILAGFLMPWLVYRLGRRYFSPQVGLVAAGVMALYLYFIYYAAALMTESFYIVGILWVLDLAGQLGQTNKAQYSKSKIRIFLFGLALALTILLRQVFLLIIPILFAWLLWQSYRQASAERTSQDNENDIPNGGASALIHSFVANIRTGSVVRMLGVILAATLILILAITPWTIRNYRVFGQFVLLNTNAGFAFFWGNHPIHGYNFISIMSPAQYGSLIPAELKTLNEAELDRALLKRGLTFVKEDPIRYLILSVSRLKDFFKFWPSAESGLISNLSRVFSFGLLLPFMVYGLIVGWRRTISSQEGLLYLFVGAYTAIHLLSWALIRYRLPVDAILLIFVGVALVDIQIKLARRQTKLTSQRAPTPVRFRE